MYSGRFWGADYEYDDHLPVIRQKKMLRAKSGIPDILRGRVNKKINKK